MGSPERETECATHGHHGSMGKRAACGTGGKELEIAVSSPASARCEEIAPRLKCEKCGAAETHSSPVKFGNASLSLVAVFVVGMFPVVRVR